MASNRGTWAPEHTGSVLVRHRFNFSVACGLFVLPPGIEPMSPQLIAWQIISHGTNREVSTLGLFTDSTNESSYILCFLFFKNSSINLISLAHHLLIIPREFR